MERRLPLSIALLCAIPLGAGCGTPAEPVAARSAYASDASCVSCHPTEAEAWSGSHHDLAMQEPTPETVLGDFADTSFTHGAETTRFSRDGDGFVVRTQREGGAEVSWNVRYVFGVEPLQQYLLEGKGGRLQCLTVAWDTEKEEWFTLYPNDEFKPSDPLHWTGTYQTWNRMCAECHSTGLEKGYDAEADTYDTVWKELDVGCQACHGPGADHVAWAEDYGESGGGDDDKGLGRVLRRGMNEAQLDACAPCHARRSRIAADDAPGEGFLDYYAPERLHAGMYHSDGQILDEVYVYGSFVQSRMHRAGVACSDCHEPHSLDLIREDNQLCTQCHTIYAPVDRFPTLEKKNYDTPAHHNHPVDSEGALCVSCHMPERTYMVVDPRRDHSFRVPRPDLSEAIGTPNACTQCHLDKSASWAAGMAKRWWGEPDDERLPFALAFEAARRGAVETQQFVPLVARDPEVAPIVRATALDLIAPFATRALDAVQAGLGDESALVRAAAVRAMAEVPEAAKLVLLKPLLNDETRLVRIEAARALVGSEADNEEDEAFVAAFAEWIAAQELSADMPWAHLNMGRVHELRGDPGAAEAAYRKALTIDTHFAPALFNLANLLNGAGRNREAEEVLLLGVERLPQEGEFFYSLGLLYAERERMPLAAEHLRRAAELMPMRPRVQYNAGLAEQHLDQRERSEQFLLRAYELQPEESDFVHALTVFYIQNKDWDRAEKYALELARLVPRAQGLESIFEEIRTGREGG